MDDNSRNELKKLDTFPAEDGHIESILIGADNVMFNKSCE